MRNSGTRGITLIELVVAMALFALVAVMGLQALTGTLHLRDRLTETDTQSSALSLALTLMRHDLEAMIPIVYVPAGGNSRSSLEFQAGANSLAFSTGGQPDLPHAAGIGFHRVQWRFHPDRKTLTRQVWPDLISSSGGPGSPEVTYLSGVTGFSLRSYWPKVGWVAGADSGQQTGTLPSDGGDSDRGAALAQSYTDALPDAVEVSVTTERMGNIVLVEGLK